MYPIGLFYDKRGVIIALGSFVSTDKKVNLQRVMAIMPRQ